MRRCSIESCESNFDTSLRSQLTFFTFPRWEDADRFDKWVEALGENPENFKHKRKYICSRHFREEDFDPSSVMRKKLMPNVKTPLTLEKHAVPSLYLSQNKSQSNLPVVNVKTETNDDNLVSQNNIKVEKTDLEEHNCNKESIDQVAVLNNAKNNSPTISKLPIKEEVPVPDACEAKEIVLMEEEGSPTDECLLCKEYGHKLAELNKEETKADKLKTLTEDYEKHKESHASYAEKKFSCSECGKKFAWAKEVKKHKLIAHSCHKCKLCHKQFVKLGGLKSHKRFKHKILNVYDCDSCDQAFFKVYDLWNHLKCHKAKNPTCMKCKKKFCNKSDYEKHECITSKRLHQCDVCTKYFGSKASLKTHKERLHSKETPNKKAKAKVREKNTSTKFTCDVCNKSYKTSHSLLGHKLSHKGIYECKFCQKGCRAPRELEAHQLTHKGVDCYNLGNLKF